MTTINTNTPAGGSAQSGTTPPPLADESGSVERTENPRAAAGTRAETGDGVDRSQHPRADNPVNGDRPDEPAEGHDPFAGLPAADGDPNLELTSERAVGSTLLDPDLAALAALAQIQGRLVERGSIDRLIGTNEGILLLMSDAQPQRVSGGLTSHHIQNTVGAMKNGGAPGVVGDILQQDLLAAHHDYGVRFAVDVNSLVQWVIRESYMETTLDLNFYAHKVKHFNEMKKAIRAQMTAYRELRSQITTAAEGDAEGLKIDGTPMAGSNSQAVTNSLGSTTGLGASTVGGMHYATSMSQRTEKQQEAIQKLVDFDGNLEDAIRNDASGQLKKEILEAIPFMTPEELCIVLVKMGHGDMDMGDDLDDFFSAVLGAMNAYQVVQIQAWRDNPPPNPPLSIFFGPELGGSAGALQNLGAFRERLFERLGQVVDRLKTELGIDTNVSMEELKQVMWWSNLTPEERRETQTSLENAPASVKNQISHILTTYDLDVAPPEGQDPDPTEMKAESGPKASARGVPADQADMDPTDGSIDKVMLINEPPYMVTSGEGITTVTELDDFIKALEEKLSSVGDDAQLANVDLQNWLQKQQQTLQLISNISKSTHDAISAVIRKIGQ